MWRRQGGGEDEVAELHDEGGITGPTEWTMDFSLVTLDCRDEISPTLPTRGPRPLFTISKHRFSPISGGYDLANRPSRLFPRLLPGNWFCICLHITPNVENQASHVVDA